MPRQITPLTKPQPVVLTRVKMRTAIARLKQRILELQAFDPGTIADRGEPRIGVLEQAIDRALIRSLGAGTPGYRHCAAAKHLDRAAHVSGRTASLNEIRAGLQRGKRASITLLEGLIIRLQAGLE